MAFHANTFTEHMPYPLSQGGQQSTRLEPVSDMAARGGKLSALASRGAPNISAKARQGDTASEYKEGQRKKEAEKKRKERRNER